MQKFTDGPHTLWVPEPDEEMNWVGTDHTYVHATIKLCTRRLLFRNVIRRMYGPSPTYTCLRAHGGSAGNGKGWHFGDAGTPKPVQEWVDSIDGTAQVIILWLCNTSNFRVRSKNSILIYPRKYVSIKDAWNDRKLFRMFLPGFGLIDSVSVRRLYRVLGK